MSIEAGARAGITSGRLLFTQCRRASQFTHQFTHPQLGLASSSTTGAVPGCGDDHHARGRTGTGHAIRRVARERRGGFERRPTMSMPPHTAALVPGPVSSRLRKGELSGNGHRIYGYHYVKKAPTAPASLAFNEEQAAVVRAIFEIVRRRRTQPCHDLPLSRRAPRPDPHGAVAMNRDQIKFMLKNKEPIRAPGFNLLRTTTKTGLKVDCALTSASSTHFFINFRRSTCSGKCPGQSETQCFVH